MGDRDHQQLVVRSSIDNRVREVLDEHLARGPENRRPGSWMLDSACDSPLNGSGEACAQAGLPLVVVLDGGDELLPRRGEEPDGDQRESRRASANTSSAGIAEISPRS